MNGFRVSASCLAIAVTLFLIQAASVGPLGIRAAHAGGRPNVAASQLTAHWQSLLGPPAVRKPSGVAIDVRGKPGGAKWAYVADAATQSIVKFGTGGKRLGSWRYGNPTNRGTPAAVAVGGSGRVFVADPATGSVLKFTPSGKLLARWTGFQDPRGLTVDSIGTAYVAEYGAHRVVELLPSGAVKSQIDTTTLWSGGSFGAPSGVALDSPESLYIATTCTTGATCGVGWDLAPNGDVIDSILETIRSGPRLGYLAQMWNGLGHLPSGSPQQPPYKESEPWVTVDAITSDRHGTLFIGGLMWPRGATAERGVLTYGPYGYKSGPVTLPGTAPVRGIAVDGKDTVYVSQGNRILKLVR